MTITAPQALQALKEVVAEAPAGRDTVYQDRGTGGECYYVRYGVPSCIVGRALHRLGVPIEVLQGLDTASMGDPIGASSLARRGVTTPDAAVVFANAQLAQDRGKTWGQALDAAQRCFDTLGPDAQ